MGSAGTLLTSTVALLVLLVDSTSGQPRSYPLPDHSPWKAVWDLQPQSPETPAPATWLDPAPVEPADPPYRLSGPSSHAASPLWPKCREQGCKLWTDYGNFYAWDSIRDLLLGIAAASVLANTSMDCDFRDWYQDDVRSSGLDDFSEFNNTFGEGLIFIPAFAGLALLGTVFDDTPCGSVVADFATRTTRGYLVGVPPLLFLQAALGGGRPEWDTDYESHWSLFDGNGGNGGKAVSGHAMIGAVPFITAAKMTDDPYLKAGLYLCSTFTAWSRVNNDNHYLSQACLGWWIAYLACSAVDKTESDYENLTFTPLATPDMVGIGVVYER